MVGSIVLMYLMTSQSKHIHDCECKCNEAVVFKAGYVFWYGNSLEAHCDNSRAHGSVEYVSENICYLFCILS